MANGDECRTPGCEKYSLEHSPYCIKCEDAQMHPVKQDPAEPEAEKDEPTCKACGKAASVCYSGFNKKQNICKICMNRKYQQAKRKREKTKIVKKAAKPAAKPKESIEADIKPEKLLIGAFKTVHDALAPLTGSERERVLKAVELLLEENYGAE